MKITGLTDKPAWSLGCAADLATPMAVRVAATLRLADHVMGGRTNRVGTGRGDGRRC